MIKLSYADIIGRSHFINLFFINLFYKRNTYYYFILHFVSLSVIQLRFRK